MTVPSVGPLRPIRLPKITDTTLANGLRVLIARRVGIPRFAGRLIIPIARPGDSRDGARLRVLTDSVLSGTRERSSRDIAETLQGMGASLGTDADAEQLLIGGSCLSSYERPFLSLFGEVVQHASFPSGEVTVVRDRIVQEIALQRSQPGAIAADALVRRLYGRHPYGWGTPDPEVVGSVSHTVLRRIYDARVTPTGALLVLVGDLDLARTLAHVEETFGTWKPGDSHPDLSAPTMETPEPALLIDRPGAVQTTIRMGGRALARTDPGYPALALAVTLLGGYFTSRLMANIRESKGYTYGVGCSIERRRVASQVTIGTDVGREVTAPALVEIGYELGRMATVPVEQAELHAARRYMQGTLAMAIQTQAGLMTTLAGRATAGLPLDDIRLFPAELERVTVDHVLEAARGYLGGTSLTTVLVGDAAVVEPAIAPVIEVER